jgi:hypothetical protein
MSKRRRRRPPIESEYVGRTATAPIPWPDEQWAAWPQAEEHRPLPTTATRVHAAPLRVSDVPCATCRCRGSAHGMGGPRPKLGAVCLRHGQACYTPEVSG